jgi:type IV pilus assembly protein PilN
MSHARIPINLASQPFQKDRPILVASGVTAFLLVLLLGVLVNLIFSQREAARESRDLLANLEKQTADLNREIARLEADMRKPANAAVLDQTVFINALLARKSVSWTRMFADLETVMPSKVRLVQVRPYITSDNHVQLEMIVGAQTQEPIIDLLKRFEGSPLFGATSLLSSQPPSQNEPLYRYRLSVNYAQKL